MSPLRRHAGLVADAYLTAFTDWLACACAGADERASKAVRACGGDLLTDVAFVATALPLSAALDAYAEGYEEMAALAAASHPALYDAGWHPTRRGAARSAPPLPLPGCWA